MLLIARLMCISLLFPTLTGNNKVVAGKKGNTYSSKPYRHSSPKVPARFSDPIVTTDSADCIIPFSRAGNLIIIKAKVDSIEGNFILDTGAPKLILNTTYFRHYPDEGNNEEAGGITGTAASSAPTMVAELGFGPVHYFRVEADRINLGHIENSKGIKIHGLLGMQLFKKFEMIIDYENSILHLHLLKNKKEAKNYKHEMLKDVTAYNTFDITILENKLLTNGQLNGKKLIFVIDTGAESNVLDSRLPDKVFENVEIVKRIALTGSGNRKIDALYGDMKNVNIGELNVATLPVLVTNLEKMCFSYNRCIDGMLGFDFLSLHKIGFNFMTNKMYIWK